MARADNKTRFTAADVTAFLESVEHPTRRADARMLNAMFRAVTGFTPRMWGPTIVGYGRYDYVYDSGREGSFLATGFSPRKANLSIYIMPGYQDYSEILARLGKHKMGKSCLYINKLADVDAAVLEELIRAGLRDLSAKWVVHPV
ncbi:DUF1801 domain-containing protein [Gymnodinialimonas ulvae]|uniref:DUF1801 domain-containing protein n=1 Tax=Gymnodinialimonas ulvae TaxID=3126504 RepID=UPI0030AE8B48